MYKNKCIAINIFFNLHKRSTFIHIHTHLSPISLVFGAMVSEAIAPAFRAALWRQSKKSSTASLTPVAFHVGLAFTPTFFHKLLHAAIFVTLRPRCVECMNDVKKTFCLFLLTFSLQAFKFSNYIETCVFKIFTKETHKQRRGRYRCGIPWCNLCHTLCTGVLCSLVDSHHIRKTLYRPNYTKC